MNVKRKSKSTVALIVALCMLFQMVLGINVWGAEAEGLTVSGLEADYAVNPIGMDNQTPSLSWKLYSNGRGVMQTSYRVMVASSEDKLAGGDYDVWDSGKVDSDQSVGVSYDGPAMTSGTRYFWKVAVTDNQGNTAASSEQAYWEMGLLSDGDWSAKWIELGADENSPAPENYSLEMDFRLVNDNAGICFAAKDSSNFLMWQVNTSEYKGRSFLRPHQWVNNSASCMDNVSIESVIPPEDQFSKMHHIKIEVIGKQITTWIDGTQVDQRTNEHAAFGKIGFRHSTNLPTNDEQALYDNIYLRDGDGTVLFSDDFSTGINSFEVGEVQNGELFVVNALGFQKDSMSSAPMYRKSFEVGSEVKKATIHASALGIYELELNGQPVSDDFFNPGWTNYELNQDNNNYVMYQTFDVTDMVRQGDNVLGAMTGHGWYSGKLFVGGNNRYGTGSKLLCQLEVEYADGSKQVIATDSSWKVNGTGPILSDDFQGGEYYNAQQELPGWSAPGYAEDSSWISAKESSYGGAIVAQMGPKVKAIQEFKPVEITEPAPGTYIVNLGQNIAGFARLNNVKGEKGSIVKLRFGEMLNKDGTLYTENLRSAKATDYYMLKGDEAGETWQPRFTFHGFQYIEVTGYPGELKAEDITGIALSSLQENTGTFETSNDLVNQLQSNIVWGQRDNFISVPTDCPQRDERLGYTGDGQVFIRTAAMNMDVNGFFKKYMKDVTSNQRADGAIADWTPNFVTPGDGASGSFGNSGWGDAIVIMPWTIYTTYGDTSIIKSSYDSMKKWIGRYESLGKGGYIVDTSAYGDWLSIGADTPKDVISTGYFAYCADLMSKMAEVIGESEDAAYYRDLFVKIREAFNNSFVGKDGRIKGNTQTSYLVALKFNLLETEQARQTAAEHLVADIQAKNWHLSTGFIGVAYLCPMLTEMGYEDVAYKLLLQEGYPSWLYSVKNGATTIWERWNSYNAETGQMETAAMNSFNHYSLGSVGEWLYNYVSGITYDENQPGYKHSVIDPHPGGGFDYVNGSFDSVYGTIVSNWSYKDGETFALDVTVPANTTATISIPAESADSVIESGVKASEADGLTFVEMKDGKAVFEAGSGSYSFTSKSARDYILNITNQDNSMSGSVSINGGEPQMLPVSEKVKNGDELTLRGGAYNDADYTFAGWSGDVVSAQQEITLTVSGNLNLQVGTAPVERTNLALNKQVNASTSINNGDWNSKNLTDGIYTSVSGHLGFTTTSTNTPGVNHWVEVDLGADTALNRIHIYPRTDVRSAAGKTASFPKDFSIQVRKDGETNYTTVKSFTDYEAPFMKPAVIELGDINARYIRLSVSRVGDPPNGESYYLQLSEMGIYNEVPPVTVDKTTLEEALASAKALNQDSYTAGSWAGMEQVIADAQSVYDHSNDQNEINQAAEALFEKIDSLIMKPDKTALKNALDSVSDYHPDNYTPDSWVKFEKVLADAQDVYDHSENQEEISAALDSLIDGILALRYRADKGLLAEAIAAAEKLDSRLYTPESWAVLENALTEAKKIMDDLNLSTEDQALVDQAVTALQDAIQGLIPVDPPQPSDVSKTILKKVLEYAADAKSGEEYAGAIASVKASFDAAYAAAQAAYDKADADQAEVDSAWINLMNEIHKLGFQAGDKAQLETLLSQANAIDLEKYVDAGQAEFKEALKNADSCLQDGDALKGDVDKAVSGLLDAMMNLRYKADKSVLVSALTRAAAVDTTIYTPESVAVFHSAQGKADSVLKNESLTQEDQAAVNAAADKLNAAISGLVKNTPVAGDSNVTQADSSPKTGETAPVTAALLTALAGICLAFKKRSR